MEWRDCVVIYIDLVDLKKRMNESKSAGSALMRAFHKLIASEMEHGLRSLDHAYAWNDSALLLAFVDESPRAYQTCLREAESLKRKVDAIARSYAIAVKGQAFPLLPDAAGGGRTIRTKRATILSTSSYAMANCFEIESAVKRRKLRSFWYLDQRIAENLKTIKPNGSFRLQLLPSRRARSVYWYDQYLWNQLM
jgi:hypothetical protein